MTPPRSEPPRDDAAATPLHRAGELLTQADTSETALKAARLARRLAPAETPAPRTDRASDRLARIIEDANPERPSAVRELGLATVAMWQGIVERRRPAPDSAPVPATILFTDLVGFSTWALRAGDDLILELLNAVNEACDRVIRRHGGQVVKTLGDGTMAVFVDAGQAIEAAFECSEAVAAITVDGHRPALRAGLHTGTPMSVGDDFLGVDVNIAARVCDAAGAGEVYASDAALAEVDTGRYVIRRRRFRAKGVPKDTVVYRVIPRYDEGESS